MQKTEKPLRETQGLLMVDAVVIIIVCAEELLRIRYGIGR